MTTIKKQCIGVDCSKDSLDVCYGQLDSQFETRLLATTTFGNGPTGINELLGWADKRISDDCELVYVVEATGVYHQALAYQLYRQQRIICVVLPSRPIISGKP